MAKNFSNTSRLLLSSSHSPRRFQTVSRQYGPRKTLHLSRSTESDQFEKRHFVLIFSSSFSQSAFFSFRLFFSRRSHPRSCLHPFDALSRQRLFARGETDCVLLLATIYKARLENTALPFSSSSLHEPLSSSINLIGHEMFSNHFLHSPLDCIRFSGVKSQTPSDFSPRSFNPKKLSLLEKEKNVIGKLSSYALTVYPNFLLRPGAGLVTFRRIVLFVNSVSSLTYFFFFLSSSTFDERHFLRSIPTETLTS